MPPSVTTDCQGAHRCPDSGLGGDPSLYETSHLSGFTENIEDEPCFLVHTDGITVRSTTQVEDCAYDFNRETIDPSELLKFIKELEYKSEKLSERNTKLQKTVEGCEEVNIHLQEQIASLRHHLKNSQQALEQSKCVSDELEDLKGIAKTVEEENSNLTHHKQHLERELQLVTEELVCLREESGALITERDLLKYKIDELSDEKRDLKVSLESIQRNLASKEEQLTEELKCEAEHLHSQLSYCTSVLTLYSLQEIPLALGSEFSEVTGSSLQVEIKEAEQDGQTIRGIEEEEKEKQKENDNDQQTDHSLCDFEKELEDCVADTKVINFYSKEEPTGYNLPNCISNKERNLPTSYEHFIYLKLFCIAWICAMLVTITCTYLDHLIYPGILVQINPTVIVTFLWNQLVGIQNPHVSLQHSGIPPF
ncbi:protein KASH5-like [Polypterus senegalus]|uniref:protein KASH5-like n=1 Tax=Polypterus senegalus TaxID=55291 RepID=UPI0019629B09|nr:protein KASH5-like [Polypterus senegalus]